MSKKVDNVDDAPAVLFGEQIFDYVKEKTSSKEWPNGVSGDRGFYPYVSEEAVINFYKNKLSKINTSILSIPEGKIIALRVPVYPKSFDGKEIEYRYKEGKFTLHLKDSGFAVRQDEELIAHYIPVPKEHQGPYFTDFEEPLFKFYAVQSNVNWIHNGDMFYFRNDVTFNRITDMTFMYEGLEFTVVSQDNILLGKGGE